MRMTKEQAITELTRCAEICPTTPLAEACRIAIGLMSPEPRHECDNCRFRKTGIRNFPCNDCTITWLGLSRWEPKEE